MPAKEYVEVSSFLEVPTDIHVKVQVNGKTYDIGYVERIYATSDDYVIWADHEHRVWFETANPKSAQGEEFHKFWNQYQSASCRSINNLSEESKYPYMRMLSSAIVSALEGQFTAADEAIEAASVFLKTANERVSRRRYTVGAVTALLFFLVISTVIAGFVPDPKSLASVARASMLGGSLGAALSALGARKTGLGFDPDASRFEGVLNGAMRVVYGVISAFLVVLVVMSGAITSPLITEHNQQLSMVAIAIAGGFAERWAADLIQRLSPETEQDPTGRKA